MPLPSYDSSHFKKTSGIIKTCCLLSEFCGILSILLSDAPSNPRGSFYIFIMIVCFCCTIAALLLKPFRLSHKSWFKLEHNQSRVISNAILAIACFAASFAALTMDLVAYTWATFFGLVAFCFYTYNAMLSYRLYRQRDVSTQTTPEDIVTAVELSNA